MNLVLLRTIFYVAAIYDALFGIMGIVSPYMAFDMFGVEPPNHVGYVQFPAILLLIFAAMFWQIARDPVGNRLLMPYGIALKAGYSGLVLYYLATTGIPGMWVPWAWADLGFLVVFVICWRQTAAVRAGSDGGT